MLYPTEQQLNIILPQVLPRQPRNVDSASVTVVGLASIGQVQHTSHVINFMLSHDALYNNLTLTTECVFQFIFHKTKKLMKTSCPQDLLLN